MHIKIVLISWEKTQILKILSHNWTQQIWRGSWQYQSKKHQQQTVYTPTTSLPVTPLLAITSNASLTCRCKINELVASRNFSLQFSILYTYLMQRKYLMYVGINFTIEIHLHYCVHGFLEGVIGSGQSVSPPQTNSWRWLQQQDVCRYFGNSSGEADSDEPSFKRQTVKSVDKNLGPSSSLYHVQQMEQFWCLSEGMQLRDAIVAGWPWYLVRRSCW